MSLVNRGIVLSMFTLALGVAPVGCALPEDDVATTPADAVSGREDLVKALDLTSDQQVQLAGLRAGQAQHVPSAAEIRATIDQMVQWFTTNLDLTPAQAAKLRTFLETHAPPHA
jgi:hypothetical protein